MTWLLLAVAAASLLGNAALLLLLVPRWHRHRWNEWSGWVMDKQTYNSQVEALRYRTCDDCAKVQQQSAGWHRCTVVDYRHGGCPHLSKLLEHGSSQRIARLEKDLGI